MSAPMPFDPARAPRARVILQVRPRGAGPPFWAHEVIRLGDPITFQWHTIIADVATKLSRKKAREVLVHLSGTTLAASYKGFQYDDLAINPPGDIEHAIEWQHVGDVIDAWFDNDPESPFTWEFQILPTGTYAG